jgi:hypothetical protein
VRAPFILSRRPPKSDHMLVGQDNRFRWVALDENKKCGGLFVSKEAARKYASDEVAGHDEAVELTSETLEFSLHVERREAPD